MTDFRVVLVTSPDKDTSSKIARALVERRLAACVNIIPKLRSIYMWKGQLCDDTEELLVIKTRTARLDELTAAVKDLHPYEVPECIALPIEAGSYDYLEWLAKETA
jgi:periplasmic divalent cation tolerance protein